jgi:acetoin utilization protein AcuB
MQANRTMTREVIVVPPELTLEAAWKIMQRERTRHLPVVRAGALIGMLSDRDVLARGNLNKDGVVHVPPAVIVGEAMTPTPVQTCEASTDVSELAKTMLEEKIDAIPVVRGLRLIGLVTSSDLLQLLIKRDEARPLPFDFRLIEEDQGATA